MSRSAIVATLMFGVSLLWAAAAGAQSPTPTFQPLPGTAMLNEDQYARDYWAKDREVAVSELVRNVEHFHMGPENFWKDYEEGRLGPARGELEFVLRYVPNHPRALYLMGMLSRQLGEDGYAIRFYERAVRLFPQYAYTLGQYGRYLTEIGCPEMGVRYLRAALRVDPTQTDAQAWLSEAEQRLARSTR